MWLAIGAFILSALALSCCAYLYLASRAFVSKGDLPSLLQSSSDALNKASEKQYRALEAEWIDMYSKFTRLAGRIDKTKGLEATKPAPPEDIPAPILRRSDLVRRRNNGRGSHVEDVSAQ